MNRLKRVVIFWGVMLPSLAFAQSADTATPNNAQKPAMIKSTQPLVTLHLPANPTTGYSWYLVKYPHAYFQVLKHLYLAPSTKNVGAGGYDVWQFKAKPGAFVVPRVFKIRMMYARAWEVGDNTPVKTFYVVTQS
ncbi:MAG: hypothetical protein COV52_08820 [Gammaproteobacteria bacterium CG11_big_fil_rev_8_21_14_0_20_46_22]|nr:MAG: hypothetical protein COW05_09880 [Gammaproteobacteria bacterium CG12_big_fil_rev_8_21_14_0_65_46_12]PIR10382.1 MAG: hypothetical protein COV52_08820 [Gammaproteobacteria bacterium CG11_big_fil_rev_8_21_14_0_20_46_22]